MTNPTTTALVKAREALNVCEVCKEPTDEEYLTGCEQCGRMFASCCNSEQDTICVECA